MFQPFYLLKLYFCRIITYNTLWENLTVILGHFTWSLPGIIDVKKNDYYCIYLSKEDVVKLHTLCDKLEEDSDVSVVKSMLLKIM
jgi:hypothetical protein